MPEKEKTTIRKFKDNSSNYWVDGKHYFMTEDGEVHFASGGIEDEKLKEELKSYIKRNKHKFCGRSPN